MPLKTASVLAFERKLDPSDALLSAGQWNDKSNSDGWPPVTIKLKSVRGTISNRLVAKDQDPIKLDAAIENPNLQKVDVAALPADADTLRVSFTLRVLPGTGKPSACNSAAYEARLLQAVSGYVETHGFSELARRYAHNLANGRFLWRNRVGAEQVQVSIDLLERGESVQHWDFDALALSLRNFEAGGSEASRDVVAALIADGLAGRRHVLLRITAFVRLGAGQEVYPSQELILDRGRGDKSKTLYDVNGVAAIHSQKVGNSIRTIDDWYVGATELGPIAVEPYGSVTTQGTAYRQPKVKPSLDFYNLFDDWLLKDKMPPLEQQHFVMAVLVRGGVFGDAGK
ncbi:MAG TPA: type I-F CRISPR-associated protein Csy3 [Castellaniella sp.]|uniref:type I-F CRISPR-associated protein Csy3 n=1 Tax=Castellaniella sp. TaxID=1955812 RepID=UPI002F0808E6